MIILLKRKAIAPNFFDFSPAPLFTGKLTFDVGISVIQGSLFCIHKKYECFNDYRDF